jgi:hypothetical protein
MRVLPKPLLYAFVPGFRTYRVGQKSPDASVGERQYFCIHCLPDEVAGSRAELLLYRII